MGVGDDVVTHGRISDGKLAEIDETLAQFRASCQEDGVSALAAVGTAAFRDAPNGARGRDCVAAGITMEIATEPRESELAYLVGSLGRDGYAVIDNGSRSIELVAKDDGRAAATWSSILATASRTSNSLRPPRIRRRRTPRFASACSRGGSSAPFMRGKKTLVGDRVQRDGGGAVRGGADRRTGLHVGKSCSRGSIGLPASRPRSRDSRQTKDIDRALPRLVVAAVLTEAFGYSQIELTAGNSAPG